MAVEHVEVLVEEPSMEVALRALLPKLLGDRLNFAIYPSQCKQDLLANLPHRLSGYAQWLTDTYRIVIVVDRDNDECQILKRRLENIATKAGLTTKTSAKGNTWQVVNRLAIEELEAWFFGDLDAIRTAYPKIPDTLERRAGFRDPDNIRGGTWETFERILQQAGYFKGGLRKIEAARSIAPHLDPDRNRSRSFQVFRDAMIALKSA